MFLMLAHLAIPFSLWEKYSIKFSLHFFLYPYLNSVNKHKTCKALATVSSKVASSHWGISKKSRFVAQRVWQRDEDLLFSNKFQQNMK